MSEKTKTASAATVRAALAKLLKEWGWSKSGIITICRGGGSSGKGSEYEREMCKRLSLWWTRDARDDVFWRSSGSGARAKVRGRGGRATAGQHGDVAATDPIGAPLIDLLTIEIKRGYSQHTFQDIVDRPVGGGVQEWERWFAQAAESAEHAGSFAWLLLTRRDRRRALVWFPNYLYSGLRDVGAFPGKRHAPFTRALVTVRGAAGNIFDRLDIVCMSLGDFLAEVYPEHILALAKKA